MTQKIVREVVSPVIEALDDVVFEVAKDYLDARNAGNEAGRLVAHLRLVEVWRKIAQIDPCLENIEEAMRLEALLVHETAVWA